MGISAGFWIRLGALLLDGIIVGVPLALLMWMFTGKSDHFVGDIISILYGSLIPVYFNGKTIGKHICRIRIVMYDSFSPYSSPTIWTMVKRNLIFGVLIVISIGIVFIIDICFVIFREDKRALHDIFAGTAVVEDIT